MKSIISAKLRGLRERVVKLFRREPGQAQVMNKAATEQPQQPATSQK